MSTKEIKTLIQRQIEDVWNNRNIDVIPDYWDEMLHKANGPACLYCFVTMTN